MKSCIQIELNKEYEYMIAGADFVSDPRAFVDTIEPIVGLMFRVQSLDTSIWKLECSWLNIKINLFYCHAAILLDIELAKGGQETIMKVSIAR